MIELSTNKNGLSGFIRENGSIIINYRRMNMNKIYTSYKVSWVRNAHRARYANLSNLRNMVPSKTNNN